MSPACADPVTFPDNGSSNVRVLLAGCGLEVT